jgi:uncharacterized protein (TIGR02145 family)
MKRKMLFCLLVVSIFVFGCKKSDNNNATNNSNQQGTVTDIDNNVYHTVTIGTQVWMVENLRTTKLNDGTVIPLAESDTIFGPDTLFAYCWYDNNVGNKNVCGALYNWFAVNTGKLAPAGWHIPSKTEWMILISFLGGEGVAGGKMKENGTSHWNSPNKDATNESGFTALSCGCRYLGGPFIGMGASTYFWSSTPEYTTVSSNSWDEGLFNIYGFIDGGYEFNHSGISVRCIKDN